MIQKKKKKGYYEIDLEAPEGNSLVLMGIAQKISKQVGEDSTELIKEMMSGNYKHLLKTLNDRFGCVIMFKTDNQEYIDLLKK